ncbi:unnamed protein product, partial [Cylicostephanus goldi]
MFQKPSDINWKCKIKSLGENGFLTSLGRKLSENSEPLQETPTGTEFGLTFPKSVFQDLFSIRLECENVKDKNVIAAVYKEIKAVFSYDEMKQMYFKCLNFVGTQMQAFEVLYRCKPREYWDEIHACRDDIMEKYIKDNNGQPANRINGLISGLFFSARTYADGSLPTHSPFGNVRMLVPPGALLDPALNNFYFADFYCNYYTHYVTVVICRKGSETDNYCYTRLYQMNPEDNPFLTVIPPPHPHYPPTYWVNAGVWVE